MMKKLCLIILMCMLGSCTLYNNGVRLVNTAFPRKNASVATVRRGDTLYSISKKYKVPLRELAEVNGLRPPYTLKSGASLRLPKAKYYTVAKGDTLYNISKRYNVEMSSLTQLNGIKAPYTLSLGQKLMLPESLVGKNYASTYTPSYEEQNNVPQSKVHYGSYQKSEYIPVKKRNSKFGWPVRGTVISPFGNIGKGRNNDGINIKAPLGTTVKAADKGTVAYAGNELKGFGNLILIKHPDGWVTAYAHNKDMFVKKGQKVIKGEKIASVGQTGGANAPQLHFEIRAGKKPVNPQSYLP